MFDPARLLGSHQGISLVKDSDTDRFRVRHCSLACHLLKNRARRAPNALCAPKRESRKTGDIAGREAPFALRSGNRARRAPNALCAPKRESRKTGDIAGSARRVWIAVVARALLRAVFALVRRPVGKP